MNDLIRRLLKETFGGGKDIDNKRGIFVGLDCSGRTTALYQLKLGERVTTIPTIGFNVETISFSSPNKLGPKMANYTLWDVGGCDKIRPLWRHYFNETDFLVFFVDANDCDRLEAARDELHRLLVEPDLQDVPFCVLANKQDLPLAIGAGELAEFLGLVDRISRDVCCVLPACSATGEGLSTMMEWIHERVSSSHQLAKEKRDEDEENEAAQEDVMSKKVEETLLDWLSREDGADDEFLHRLEECTLDCWDHRTHLRIAWLLLSRHGRKDGLDKIFSGIRHYIANSKRTHSSRGTTFHETMTYFWTHMVHYAMVTTTNSHRDFKTFLLLNPQLANGGLFLHYYSQKLMLQTADSRMQVVLPDLRPLPSLVTDVATTSSRADKVVMAPRSAPLCDEAFWRQWQERTLQSWGHEARLRAIWLCLHRYDRREGVKKAFDGLEAMEKTGHHVTAAYFWIQMTDYAIRKIATGSEEIPTFGIFIQKPAAQMLRNPDLMSKYYSLSIQGVLGKRQFQVPDKKPLPSTV